MDHCLAFGLSQPQVGIKDAPAHESRGRQRARAPLAPPTEQTTVDAAAMSISEKSNGSDPQFQKSSTTNAVYVLDERRRAALADVDNAKFS